MSKLYFIPPLILQTLIWIPTRLIFKFFAKIKINGVENLRNISGGVVFAVNHSSELDPILVPSCLPFLSQLFPMFYTSRESRFYSNCGWRRLVYGGLFFKIWGAYPVKVGLHNYEASLEHHIRILQDGHSVCIFPEGQRTKTGLVGEGKGGAAYLAWRANVPIVPVGIKGAFRTSFGDFFGRRRFYSLSFGAPIYPGDLFGKEAKLTITENRDDCRLAMLKVMGEIAKFANLPIGNN